MSTHDVTITVNGTEEELTVEARTLLVSALREEFGDTSPKVGCERGVCGACTVHVDGEPVKSCTTLAVQADGREVTTVAGVGGEDGRLHPVQEALHEAHGLQCGYCSPGMVMTIVHLLEAEDELTRDAVREALKGNVCRCTGYQKIVDGVLAAADAMDGVTVADPDPDGTSTRSASGRRPASDTRPASGGD